ncbi:TPA: HNH endonuclease [Pseudomonas aeruginosa]
MRHIPLPEGITLDGIKWRMCHATNDYEVSEYGHVRRVTPGKKTWPGKVLSFCWHRQGYPRFKLTINGKHQYFEAHRLVALAFIGSPIGDRTEVAHRDGNPSNNHFSNLAWKTHQENEDDKRLHGTLPKGAKNGSAKLTEDAVREIRNRRAEGVSLAVIGHEFGVAFQTVSKIVNGHSWSHV